MELGVQIAELRGEMASVRADLSEVKDRVRAPKVMAVAASMGTVALVLLSIGGLALSPIYQTQAHLTDVLSQISRQITSHRSDGHPESVRHDIGRIFEFLRDKQDSNDKRVAGLHESIQESALEIVELKTRLQERTQRFEEMIRAKADDRWTFSQQTEYGRRVDDRLLKLDKMLSGDR